MKRSIQDLNLYDVRAAFVGSQRWHGTFWSRSATQDEGALVGTKIVLEALEQVKATHERGSYLVEVDRDEHAVTTYTVFNRVSELYFGITVDASDF